MHPWRCRLPKRRSASHRPKGASATWTLESASRSRGTARQDTWSTWLLTTWIAGLALGLVGELLAGMRIRHICEHASPVPPAVHREAQHIAAQLGCRMPLSIRQTERLASPCVVGVLRPTILLPSADCRGGAPSELRAILAHEITHLRGSDLAWNNVLRLSARLLWFHPLMWYARGAHASACDAVCDACAAELVGDVAAYGRTLARVALRVAGVSSVAGLAMARRSTVRRRIEALHHRLHTARLTRTPVAIAIVASLLIAGLCGSITLTRAAAPAGPSISGTIVDSASKPIAGATVYVYSAGAAHWHQPLLPHLLRRLRQAGHDRRAGALHDRSARPGAHLSPVGRRPGYQPESITAVDPVLAAPA